MGISSLTKLSLKRRLLLFHTISYFPIDLIMKQVAIVVLAIVGMVAADTEQAGDPYADYYKHFYETHTGQVAQERNPHGHSSGGLSELATPETALVVGAAGLLAGLLGIAAYINQQDDLKSVCKTAKEVGDTKLVKSATTNFVTVSAPTAAEVVARLNLIEDAINKFSTPDCSS